MQSCPLSKYLRQMKNNEQNREEIWKMFTPLFQFLLHARREGERKEMLEIIQGIRIKRPCTSKKQISKFWFKMLMESVILLQPFSNRISI